MLWVCQGCTTRYAETLTACPNCGEAGRVTELEDEEAAMPKNTIHAGPTNADLGPLAAVEEEPVEVPVEEEPVEVPVEEVPVEDGVQLQIPPAADPAGPGPAVTVDAGAAEATATVPGDPERPASTAAKADWAAYVTQLDPTVTAADMTKAELIATADRLEAG